MSMLPADVRLLHGEANAYDLPHPDIDQSKLIEPYYELFRLFGMRNKEMITLCLAAVRTLLRETEGVFNRAEMENVLAYLNPSTRARVFAIIEKYKWVTNDGIRYELPEHVRNLSVFIFGAMTRPEEDFAREIDISFALSDLDTLAGTDRERAYGNFEAAIGTLRKIRAQLQRAIEQKSWVEARRMMMRSADMGHVIDRVYKRVRDWNRDSYQYTLTTEVQALIGEIIRLYDELLLFVLGDIQSNARAFGQYLTPEQIEGFLAQASLDQLASIIKLRFSSPLTRLSISSDELLARGIAYLQQQREFQELTPPPPVVSIVRQEVVIDRKEGPAFEYYRELMSQLEQSTRISIPEAVVKNSFGETLFRTGLLITIRREIADMLDQPQFEIIPDGSIQELPDGPVDRMTGGFVTLATARRESNEFN